MTRCFLLALAQAAGYHPHGACYLWQPGLMWLHAGSDTLIALAYYAIPLGLIYFVRQRKDIPFDWMFVAFAVFILACGTTHAMAVWTLWHPDYWASGAVKLVTAGASLATAVLLVPLIPKALTLPNPTQLERVNTDLAAANAALETFAYSVSHDLRAPLRAMQGFADALAQDYGKALDQTGREYATRIADAGRRMDALINDLLEYHRVGSAALDLGTVDLERAVEKATDNVRATLDAAGAEIDVRRPLPSVRGHETALNNALVNLFTNAAKFVPPGTRPRIRVWAERTGNTVRLAVGDNGIGIAPEHQERIFRMFERLHGQDRYPGTGVGLAIVAKTVERMGGTIAVESRDGAGSTFWITLRPGEGL